MHKAVHGEGAFFTDSPEEALSYTGLVEYDFEDWDEFDAYATESGLLYEVFLNIRDRDRLYERSGGAWHARAIAPNEIKSATDNRGTFDGGNYPEFKEWREQQGETTDLLGDAYVLIVVAEGESRDVFYDLDVTSVEEVENNKGVSANLEATRIPNPGRQDSNTPKGRIHRFKEYVNHIDVVNEKSSFSLDKEQSAGMFRDGHLVASNAVVTEPGVSFSIESLQASPYNFRKFGADFMGKGEGAQAFSR